MSPEKLEGQNPEEDELYAPTLDEEADEYDQAYADAERIADEQAKPAAAAPAAEPAEEPYQYQPEPVQEQVPAEGEPAAAAQGGEAQPAAEPAPAASARPEPTKEQVAAHLKRQILDEQKRLTMAMRDFERQFGPLRTDEEIQAELESLEAESYVRRDLPEVARTVETILSKQLGELQDGLQAASATERDAIQREIADLRITQYHPDYVLIRDNPQDLIGWINELPHAHGAEMERRYRDGTPEEIAEMLAYYKQGRGITDFRELSQEPRQEAPAQPAPPRGVRPGAPLAAAVAVPSRVTRLPVSLQPRVNMDDYDAGWDEQDAATHN